MRLETNTVDPCSVSLYHLDDVCRGRRLSASVLDVVIVVVELGGWVNGCSRCESNGNIRRADGVVEGVGTECTIVIES